MKHHLVIASCLLAGVAAQPMLAYAEIGEIGSPVKASNLPDDDSDTNSGSNSNFGAIGSPVRASNMPEDDSEPPAGMGGIGSPVRASNPEVMVPADATADNAAQQTPVGADGKPLTTPPVADPVMAGQGAAVNTPAQPAATPDATPPTTTGIEGIPATANAPLMQPPVEQPAAGLTAVPVESPNPSQALPAKPLMVVRFNQTHVYFGHSLDQAVASAQHAKSDTVYNLVSYVPSGSDSVQTGHINQVARSNLDSMVQELKNQGVPASRIVTSTQSATDGMQRVEMFVQ